MQISFTRKFIICKAKLFLCYYMKIKLFTQCKWCRLYSFPVPLNTKETNQRRLYCGAPAYIIARVDKPANSYTTRFISHTNKNRPSLFCILIKEAIELISRSCISFLNLAWPKFVKTCLKKMLLYLKYIKVVNRLGEVENSLPKTEFSKMLIFLSL